MQRAGQERAGEPGEQPARTANERTAPAIAADELAASLGRQHEPLRAVPRERMRGRMAFGREGDERARPRRERSQQDDERERQAIRRVLREQAGDERAEREAADVRDRADDARTAVGAAPSGPASRSAMYAVAVATVAPSARPVRTRATSRPASDCQAMNSTARGRGDDQRRDQHGPPAVPVGHVAGEQQARDDAG